MKKQDTKNRNHLKDTQKILVLTSKAQKTALFSNKHQKTIDCAVVLNMVKTMEDFRVLYPTKTSFKYEDNILSAPTLSVVNSKRTFFRQKASDCKWKV